MTMTAENPPTSPAPLEITPAAMEVVLGIRAEEEDPEALGLRIEITGTKGVDFVYDLAFDELSNATDTDVVVDLGEIQVVIPEGSLDQLRGSVLDVPRSPGQSGLVIRNPNRPDPLAGVELTLEGTVAEKVEQLLAGSINPALAAHGGFATLVGVEDGDEEGTSRVFLTMGGGCQGCAMSAMTLREGIDRAIREAIPEVVEVIDVTEHAAGENPFY